MIFPPQGYKNISYKWLNQGIIFRPHGSYSGWKDTLRHIALVHHWHQLAEFPVEHIDIDTLAPLILLWQLTYLRLEGYAMELTDDNISDMTIAWPEIDTLLHPFVNAIHLWPTIASLCTIACRCPNLRYLTIPLNTLDLAPFISTRVLHTPVHELHTLTIANADDPLDPRDLLHAAWQIDYLFPKLKILSSYEGHDADWWVRRRSRWQAPPFPPFLLPKNLDTCRATAVLSARSAFTLMNRQSSTTMSVHQRLEAATDFSKLSPISDDIIVACLRERFMMDTIYTNIGASILSLSTLTNTSRQTPTPSYKNMLQSIGIHQNARNLFCYIPFRLLITPTITCKGWRRTSPLYLR